MNIIKQASSPFTAYPVIKVPRLPPKRASHTQMTDPDMTWTTLISASSSADAQDPSLVYLLVDEGQRLYDDEAKAAELFNTMKAFASTGATANQQPRLRIVVAATYGSHPTGIDFEIGTHAHDVTSMT